ncbi:helix-turn-helix transcriptional regulator [Microlunatus elymi]|uniref:Helix-turn-helix transcriptional regulator n=1 Tax=Microlunatus elymi TaxID=2596828 RepID=A0A516Q1X1_9ACTN|nr:TetR/AcrR family transcriptional regulator [Microlunatus elymi]QDP97398.1 helix-turn-helix transcriptional regulator [Microlunatus elymi]
MTAPEASTPDRARNLGPRAAAANRRALLEAARRVFGSQGAGAPLSAVAKEARVGQGSLYRHFPTRQDLVYAVFAEGVDELEAYADAPGADLRGLLRALLDQMLASTAFLQMLDDRREDRMYELGRRVGRRIDRLLPAARRDGLVGEQLTTDDVMFVIAMLAGALTMLPPTDRERAVNRLAVMMNAPWLPTPSR